MQNPAKVLKIVSIIILVFAICNCIFAVMLMAGGAAGVAVGTNTETADVINSAAAEDTEVSSALDAVNSAINDSESGDDMGKLAGADVVTAFSGVGILAGIIVLVSAIWNIICAVVGLKGAKSGSTKAAFVLGIIALVLLILPLFSNSGNIVFSVLGIVLFAIYTYCAYQLKDGNVQA